MNSLFHFSFSYLIVSLIFGQKPELIPIIAFFSIALDLDHLPYVIKNFRSLIRYLRFGSVSRTRSHEIFGLLIISSIIFFISFFYKNIIILQVILLCIMLHYAIDFMIGYSRPFNPYSNQEVFLKFYSSARQRVLLEMTLTIAGVIAFWFMVF